MPGGPFQTCALKAKSVLLILNLEPKFDIKWPTVSEPRGEGYEVALYQTFKIYIIAVLFRCTVTYKPINIHFLDFVISIGS